MDLYKEDDRNRLWQATVLSYRKQEPFRRLNESLVAESAGPNYGSDSTRPRYEQYMNIMLQAVDAYTMGLVANRPQVLVTTRRETMKFFAKHYAIAINNLLQEIELEKILRQWVLNAFYCMGIIKVHWADVGDVEFGNKTFDPGTPFASNIGLDDWVHDMNATCWNDIQFAADAYRVPLEELKGEQYDQKEVAKLQPSEKGAADGLTERVDNLSQGSESKYEDIEPMVDVMDVWIPRHNTIYTFAMDPVTRFQGIGAPLAAIEWEGPEAGPYHVLGFNDVPSNVMPASPASHIASLARLVNNLYRKQARQAKRQKDVYTYTPGSGAESAKKVQRTNDGEWVEVQDKNEVGVMKMGGVDVGNQAFMTQAVGDFDRMAGNLPSMLGLGPQAETLGQEELIRGAASKKEAHMRMRTLEATRTLVRNLAKMLWDDVAKILPGQMPVPGVDGISIESSWTPEYRMGEFYDYDMDIEVFSMPYTSPGEKAKTLVGLLTEVYAPFIPMLQEQGGSVNLQAATEIFAELLHLPRLKDVVQFSSATPGSVPEQIGPQVPTGPPAASSGQIRRNVSMGGTPQQQNQQKQTDLLGLMKSQNGGGVQNQQAQPV